MSKSHGFTLDRFQLDAIAELDRGHSVLVAAPTGSGKTVVAEAAIDMALASGGRAFYTTPVKALSNQKYADLCRRLGPERVGLLTGDNSISPDASVVVMTTEVLRNMIYSASGALSGLHVVVLDEVHYLQDTYRGSVWEEVIIHLPANVALVCLSATVSNAAELGSWLGTVRGPTATIVETERPVELIPLYLVGDRNVETPHLLPVLVDGRGNPEAYRLAHDPRVGRRRHQGGSRPRQRFYAPRRVQTIELLADEDLLPAITFIFSRKACDQAAAECRDAGVRLTSPTERSRIRQIAEDAVWDLSDSDLDALGFDGWLAALEVGVAAHHAGLIPAFKEAVEACFVQGLIKVVFATETLALGINMPARSVVIERLSKYNGESHEFLTPGEFTQLTGRAGRRGLDDVGYAVVPWSPFVTFDQVVGLVASRSFPLVSSFRPTYNMAANLVRRWPRDEAYEVIGQSFAQFQADRAMVGLQRRLHEDRARLESLGAASRCERGDVAEYVALVERARRAERRTSGRGAIEQAAAMLRPGELVVLGDSPEANRAAVIISVAHRGRGSIKIKAVDSGGSVHALDVAELTVPLRPYGEVTLPAPFAPSDPSFLDQCAELVSLQPPGPPRRPKVVDGGPTEADELAAEVLVHPVNRCPDRDVHIEALAELAKVEREAGQLADAVQKRGGSLARRLDAVVDLLSQRGFLDGWALTDSGQRLARLYHECDLVIAESLDLGLLDGLDAPDIAAVASIFTYEERRSDPPPVPPLRHGRAGERISQIGTTARRVQRAEREGGLPQTRLPDAGFAAVALEWARGGELAEVLGAELPAGDFVRNIKVLVDLLRQIGEVASQPETAQAARQAADALVRGVVATSSEVTTRETGTESS